MRDMIKAEETLLKMIMEENISSIYIMGSRLGETPEVVNSIISELMQAGHVEGHFSEDGKRFFRTDAKVVDRPILAVEDEGPSFLQYNTRLNNKNQEKMYMMITY